MSSRLIAGIVAGICGTFFLGYCIYFDRKRRSDPMFKERLLEKRRKAREAKKAASVDELKSRVPDMKDAAAVQQFFLEEVQLGEDYLAQGDFDQTVKHLTNAVAVCGQPQQLLQMFQQTLPPQVFQMLIENLNNMKSTILTKPEDGDSLD